MKLSQKIYKYVWAIFALSILFAQGAWAAVYDVDVDHTTVGFKIRHLFSNVTGNFTMFNGTINYEPGAPQSWSTSGTIDVSSINTNVKGRDKHLLTADFFNVEKFPKIEFQSTGVENATEKTATLKGTFKMHGVEKPITLDVEIHGVGKDPWGNVRAGFTAKTKINRKDFGLDWNQTLETGGVLVGDEVEITLEVEGILKEEKITTENKKEESKNGKNE